jgi:hypothetical protein
VALDSGADPAVGQWATEIQARELAADARVRAATGTCPGPERMTIEQASATVTAISDLIAGTSPRDYGSPQLLAEVRVAAPRLCAARRRL